MLLELDDVIGEVVVWFDVIAGFECFVVVEVDVVIPIVFDEGACAVVAEKKTFLNFFVKFLIRNFT